MTWRLVHVVLEHSRARGGARMLLVTIVERIDEKKGYAYPALADITRRSRVSRRVLYVRTTLERLGEPVRRDVLTEAIGYLRAAAATADKPLPSLVVVKPEINAATRVNP